MNDNQRYDESDGNYERYFNGHQIWSHTDHEWFLRQPTTTMMWARIISCPPDLIVVGDFMPTIFRGHPMDGVTGMVKWVATSNLDYLATKVECGMGTGLGGEECPDKFQSDLRFAIEDADELGKRTLLNAIKMVESQSYATHEIKQYICDEIRDGWDMVGEMGMVPSRRLMIARAACRRLVFLLSKDSSKGVLHGRHSG